MQRRKILIIFRVVRLELGGAEVEEIAGGNEEEEVHTYIIITCEGHVDDAHF